MLCSGGRRDSVVRRGPCPVSGLALFAQGGSASSNGIFRPSGSGEYSRDFAIPHRDVFRRTRIQSTRSGGESRAYSRGRRRRQHTLSSAGQLCPARREIQRCFGIPSETPSRSDLFSVAETDCIAPLRIRVGRLLLWAAHRALRFDALCACNSTHRTGQLRYTVDAIDNIRSTYRAIKSTSRLTLSPALTFFSVVTSTV